MKADTKSGPLVNILRMYFMITVSNLAQKYSKAWLCITEVIHKTPAITDLEHIYFAITKH